MIEPYSPLNRPRTHAPVPSDPTPHAPTLKKGWARVMAQQGTTKSEAPTSRLSLSLHDPVMRIRCWCVVGSIHLSLGTVQRTGGEMHKRTSNPTAIVCVSLTTGTVAFVAVGRSCYSIAIWVSMKSGFSWFLVVKLIHSCLNFRFNMSFIFTANYFFSGMRCLYRQWGALDDRLRESQDEVNSVFQRCS
jgi:hypothetical protein